MNMGCDLTDAVSKLAIQHLKNVPPMRERAIEIDKMFDAAEAVKDDESNNEYERLYTEAQKAKTQFHKEIIERLWHNSPAVWASLLDTIKDGHIDEDYICSELMDECREGVK